MGSKSNFDQNNLSWYLVKQVKNWEETESEDCVNLLQVWLTNYLVLSHVWFSKKQPWDESYQGIVEVNCIHSQCIGRQSHENWYTTHEAKDSDYFLNTDRSTTKSTSENELLFHQIIDSYSNGYYKRSKEYYLSSWKWFWTNGTTGNWWLKGLNRLFKK